MSGVHARFHKVPAFINLTANFFLILFSRLNLHVHENNVLATDWSISLMEGAMLAFAYMCGVHFCGGRVFKTDCTLKEVFEMVG